MSILPELLERIRKEAEEKYPTYPNEEIEANEYPMSRATMRSVNDIMMLQQKSHIESAIFWAEKLEQIREEIAFRKNAYHTKSDEHSAGHFHEASFILSLIDKHLKG